MTESVKLKNATARRTLTLQMKGVFREWEIDQWKVEVLEICSSFYHFIFESILRTEGLWRQEACCFPLSHFNFPFLWLSSRTHTRIKAQCQTHLVHLYINLLSQHTIKPWWNAIYCPPTPRCFGWEAEKFRLYKPTQTEQCHCPGSWILPLVQRNNFWNTYSPWIHTA